MRIGFRSIQELILLVCLLALTACGGGGGGSTPPPKATATLAYASAAQSYTVGTAITPLTPTITGTLTSFSISPSLPFGLSMDTSTGVISGTPTAVTITRTCTVTATGPNGATASATVTVTINDVAPSQISYGSTGYTYTAGYAGSTLTPKATGGVVTGWSINPQLPQGLSFNTTNGSISGTPTAATASASYVVTAQNTGGSGTVSLTIAVNAGPLIHLGHQNNVLQVRVTANNVLSLDGNYHWILWDYSGHSVIATGNTGCEVGPQPCLILPTVDLEGTTAAIVNKTGFELHSTTDGHTLGTITANTANWWKLATDGSYLAAGNSSGVSVWSSSGQLLFLNSGDYSKAVAFAQPSQLLIGGGPAATNAIETIAVPSGTSSTGTSFNGTFSSWFLDGGQFITQAGTTVLIYNSSTLQQVGTITSVSASATVVGQGNWVWAFPGTGGTLNIYPATGSGSTPTVSYTFSGLSVAAGSGSTIGVETQSSGSAPSTISVIDLSGATPVKTAYTANLYTGEWQPIYTPYAAVSASQWVAGGSSGVLVDGPTLSGTPTYFGYGQVQAVAGGSSHFAIATASGTILYFNSATLAQEGQIAFNANQLQMSADGTLLAAVGSGTFTGTDPVNIYSLPAGSQLYSWPYDLSGSSQTVVEGIALSGNGTVLGQVLYNLPPSPGVPSYVQRADSPTGGSPVFSSSFTSLAIYEAPWAPPLVISPDGTLIAYSQSGSQLHLVNSSTSSVGTNLLLNGSLVTAFSGLPVGWLDNNRLFVNTYTTVTSDLGVQYAGCALYGANGMPTGAPCGITTVELSSLQPVSTDGIYTAKTNQILSVSTGATTWSSGDPVQSGGAVAGSNVIFVSGIDALAQPF